jgi:signal transduction histidine kinase
MKHIMHAAVLLCALAGLPLVANAQGSADDAIALVRKVIAAMKSEGKQKGIEDVNRGKYVERDLYVTVHTLDGTDVANSVNPRLVGKSVIDLKDADGKPFVRQALEEVRKNGKAWTDFKWPNPVTGKIEQKATYSERFEDVVVNCGIYKVK